MLMEYFTFGRDVIGEVFTDIISGFALSLQAQWNGSLTWVGCFTRDSLCFMGIKYTSGHANGHCLVCNMH